MAVIGDLLTEIQPTPVNIQAGSPPTADLEQNKGLWRQFLEKTSDPNFRQAMFRTGIGLLRSPQYGQNRLDVAANALDTGATTLMALREAERVKNLQAQQISQQTAAQQTAAQQGQQRIDLDKRRVKGEEAGRTQTAEQAQALLKQKEAELAEATRSNKSTEDINRLKAEADMLRAKAYSGAGGRVGQTAADIQKINFLTDKYVQDGMEEVSARARATRELEFSKGKTKADTARELFKAAIDNPFNYKRLAEPNGREALLQEALDTAEKIHATDTAPGDQPGAPAPTPSPGTPAPGAPASAGAAKPETRALVDRAKTRGVQPAAIKAAIQARGENPALYGY